MNIYRAERYYNSEDDSIIELRINIFTKEIQFVGVVVFNDGTSFTELGVVKLQSQDIFSAVNEWRLKHPEIIKQLNSSISTLKKVSSKKISFWKKLFCIIKK